MVRRTWTRSRIAAACFALLPATACGNPFSSDDDGTDIRLRNSSSFELRAVTFQPGTPQVKYDRIAGGETTNYVRVPNAYSYGYLDVTIDGARRVIQPIDYVGESYVGEGRFTYVITIDAATRNPSMTMVKDD